MERWFDPWLLQRSGQSVFDLETEPVTAPEEKVTSRRSERG